MSKEHSRVGVSSYRAATPYILRTTTLQRGQRESLVEQLAAKGAFFTLNATTTHDERKFYFFSKYITFFAKREKRVSDGKKFIIDLSFHSNPSSSTAAAAFS